MAVGYVFFAGIALYIILLRWLDSPKASPLKAAAILVAGYYALLAVVLAIDYSTRDIPLLPNLFEPMRVVTAVVQFIIAANIFHRVDEDSDSYMTYMLWGGAGLALIFFVVEPMVQRFFTMIIY